MRHAHNGSVTRSNNPHSWPPDLTTSKFLVKFRVKCVRFHVKCVRFVEFDRFADSPTGFSMIPY